MNRAGLDARVTKLEHKLGLYQVALVKVELRIATTVAERQAWPTEPFAGFCLNIDLSAGDPLLTKLLAAGYPHAEAMAFAARGATSSAPKRRRRAVAPSTTGNLQ